MTNNVKTPKPQAIPDTIEVGHTYMVKDPKDTGVLYVKVIEAVPNQHHFGYPEFKVDMYFDSHDGAQPMRHRYNSKGIFTTSTDRYNLVLE